MTTQEFLRELASRIARFDLLSHPFYRAWSAGELTKEELRAYSADYYHHVAAFPTYLSVFHSRLGDGSLRRAIARNLADEEVEGIPHSELWLDFAEAMGNCREDVRSTSPRPVIARLIATFRRIAGEGSPAAALAAFYAYESQVPRIAEFKERALRQVYGVDELACRYFALHKAADIHHSQVWHEQLGRVIDEDPSASNDALSCAEVCARRLWGVLDAMSGREISSVD